VITMFRAKHIKCILFALSVTFAFTHYLAGHDICNTQWLSEDFEYLYLDDSTATFKSIGLGIASKMPYIIKGDSLVIYTANEYERDQRHPEKRTGLSFIIKETGSYFLVLQPYKDSSIVPDNLIRRYVRFPSLSLDFYKKDLFIDTAEFKRICYQVYGGCLYYIDNRYLVDKNKRFYYYNNLETKPLNGYFTGVLPDSLYSQFLDLMKNHAITRLSLSVSNVNSTAPQSHFSIYFGDNLNETDGPIIPSFVSPFFGFLQSLPKKVELNASKEAEDTINYYFKRRLPWNARP
jgi:hypothetical protein